MRPLLRLLFGYLILGVMAGGTASAEECSGAITVEEALRVGKSFLAYPISDASARRQTGFNLTRCKQGAVSC